MAFVKIVQRNGEVFVNLDLIESVFILGENITFQGAGENSYKCNMNEIDSEFLMRKLSD
jgi:hypothetical protein